MYMASFQWLLIVVTKFIYSVDGKWITGNLCWSMPCLNGGSCFGSAYTYLCVCPMNYSGALCEKRLGICQESPCGNRGLCVETGLTSFECRCYFDYTGPLCEEHVPKDDPLVWSSLIPVHTRVLFDMLQEAYRSKVNEKSTVAAKPGRPKTRTTITTTRALPSETTLSTTIKSNDRTEQSVTIGTETIIKSEDIQLEKIFPEMSTVSLTKISPEDSSLITSQTFQTTEQNTFNNEITMTSTIRTLSSEIKQTPTLPPVVTVENITTKSLEQDQTNFPNVTEKQELINSTEQNNASISSATLSSLSVNSSDNNISSFTYESTQNSTEQINNTTDSNDFIQTTAQTISYETNNYSSNRTETNQLNSSEQSIATTVQPISTTTFTEILSTSQPEYDKFLYRLCQQLLSHILPNASSLSSPKAVEAALHEASNSSSNRNGPVNELLSWIKEQLDSTTTPKQSTTTIPTTTVPTTTIPTTTVPTTAIPTTTVPTTTITTTIITTTTITTTISTTTTPTTTEKTTATTTTTTISPSTTISPRLSLLIHGKTLTTISLERLDMDEVLHPLNINNDGD